MGPYNARTTVLANGELKNFIVCPSIKSTDNSHFEDGQCYEDCVGPQRSRILPDDKILNDDSMTIEKCKNFCFGKDFHFAGVEYADECWCGNKKPSSDLVKPSSECNIPCAGGTFSLSVQSEAMKDKKYLLKSSGLTKASIGFVSSSALLPYNICSG